MTTITVEISKAKDLDAIKSFIANLGLKYDLDKSEDLVYTDEVKKMLDTRYEEIKSGKVNLISAEESNKRIEQLLKGK